MAAARGQDCRTYYRQQAGDSGGKAPSSLAVGARAECQAARAEPQVTVLRVAPEASALQIMHVYLDCRLRKSTIKQAHTVKVGCLVNPVYHLKCG